MRDPFQYPLLGAQESFPGLYWPVTLQLFGIIGNVAFLLSLEEELGLTNNNRHERDFPTNTPKAVANKVHPDSSATSESHFLPRQPSLVARVTQQPFDSIVAGQFRAGERLSSERDLSEQFGASRMVTRVAFLGLEVKGVVKVEPGRGLRVASVSSLQESETFNLRVRGQQIEDKVQSDDISEVREILELRIVELDCQRASDEDLLEIKKAFELPEQPRDSDEAAENDSRIRSP